MHLKNSLFAYGHLQNLVEYSKTKARFVRAFVGIKHLTNINLTVFSKFVLDGFYQDR
jgi:hypothetical protein